MLGPIPTLLFMSFGTLSQALPTVQDAVSTSVDGK